VRELKDRDYNPNLPLQTKYGAAQALRVGKTSVDDFIADGLLEAVHLKNDEGGKPSIARVTTESILRLIESRRRPVA
jgi:hypothetical protein